MLEGNRQHSQAVGAARVHYTSPGGSSAKRHRTLLYPLRVVVEAAQAGRDVHQGGCGGTSGSEARR